MLNREEIENNKLKFLQLVNEIQIPGADMQGLLSFLNSSDFFVAPASTMYHSSFEGGLCYHSLNVYDNLVKLSNLYFPNTYSKDTLLILGLFHDISKTGFYESTTINKKIYNEHGSKSDNKGKFDWFSEDGYKVKDAKERFLSADHGTNSFLILSRYIPLMEEEITALINHHGSMAEVPNNKDLTYVFNRYPLAMLLHLADLASTYLVPGEKV